MRSHLGEIQSAVEKRNTGGEHHGVCGDAASRGGQLAGFVSGDSGDTSAIDQYSACLTQISRQGAEEVDWIDLQLIGRLSAE